MTGSRVSDYERWPDGGRRPTAYVLLMLAKMWETRVERLLDHHDYAALDDKQLFEVIELCHHDLQDVGETAEEDRTKRRDLFQIGGLAVAGRALDTPLVRAVTPDEVIERSAEESADLAAWAGASNVDDDGLQQLHQHVRSIAHAYLYAPPYPLLQRTRQLRAQVARLLGGHQHPDQTRELYLIAARLCTMLAFMCGDLGNNEAAREHARAAWRCAEHADHDGARMWARTVQSKTAFYDGDYGESARLARDGLRFTPSGTAAVRLTLLEARAWARLRRVGEAKGALDRWRTERERVPGRDEVGGLLGTSVAQQHYLAGSTYLLLGQPGKALAESGEAIARFEATPDDQRFYGPEMIARIDAGRAYLHGAQLDGAVHALQPVLAVDPEQRLATIVQSLGQVRTQLALPGYRGSAQARSLREQIAEYCSQAVGAKA